jgi:hypothetical protein
MYLITFTRWTEFCRIGGIFLIILIINSEYYPNFFGLCCILLNHLWFLGQNQYEFTQLLLSYINSVVLIEFLRKKRNMRICLKTVFFITFSLKKTTGSNQKPVNCNPYFISKWFQFNYTNPHNKILASFKQLPTRRHKCT